MAERKPREKQRLHWTTEVVFKVANEKGLASPGWQPFSSLIEEKTGVKIPPGTLKYWHSGYSTPKVDELEAMADSLGLEMDLLTPEAKRP